MLKPWGMALPAWRAYIQAMYDAELSPERVVQTIGNAAASAGTHAQDGILDGAPYCAAVDLSVRDLDDDAVHQLVNALASNGFCAFFRCPGHDGWPASDLRHVHAVFAGLPMKELLREQVHAWLHGGDGLADHGPERFFQPSEQQQQLVRSAFLVNNPEVG